MSEEDLCSPRFNCLASKRQKLVSQEIFFLCWKCTQISRSFTGKGRSAERSSLPCSNSTAPGKLKCGKTTTTFLRALPENEKLYSAQDQRIIFGATRLLRVFTKKAFESRTGQFSCTRYWNTNKITFAYEMQSLFWKSLEAVCLVPLWKRMWKERKQEICKTVESVKKRVSNLVARRSALIVTDRTDAAVLS